MFCNALQRGKAQLWGAGGGSLLTSLEGVCHLVQKAGEQPVGRLGEFLSKIIEWGRYEILEDCKVSSV